jgi:acyl transferase domain-containing protein
VGRKAFTHRRAVVGGDGKELAAVLRERAPNRVFTQGPVRGAPPVVFMFAGGGAQYPGMGADLYQHEPRYRAVIDQGAAHMKATAGIDLLALLYPPAAAMAAARERLVAPTLALPTLFVTQYALASVLLAWGIKPDAMIGHSMGEYVAACLAGVLTYEEALGLVFVRGQLFETVPPGGMLSIQLAEADVRRLLEEGRAWSGLSMAAVNAPDLCVVSGANESITALEKVLTEREIESVRIHIAVPAHSEMLAPILPAFERHCRTIPFRPPQRRYVSNLTGDWITAPEATNPRYWVDHLRHTVKFSAGLTTLAADPKRVLLEVGPGRTLTSLARAQFGAAARAISTLPHPGEPESARGFLLGALGRMWTHGVDVDWAAFYENQRRLRVPLPTYPFERKRHWIPRSPAATAAPASTHATPRGPSRGGSSASRTPLTSVPTPRSSAASGTGWLANM